MGLLPNVRMNLLYPAGNVRREKSLVDQVWGQNSIASKVLGGMLLNEVGRSDK